MKLSEYQIEENYVKLISSLKPEFGNTKHLDISNLAEKIVKLQIELTNAVGDAKRKRLKQEILQKKKIALGWGK